MNEISKKKPFYPIITELNQYLEKFERLRKIPIRYEHLVNFNDSMPVFDRMGRDTLWETVFFSPAFQEELHRNLVNLYSMLKFEGKSGLLEHLIVDRIDYCTFGNSKPFRIRIVNQYNDNYDYYYVKRADASRIYGLELEEILSPNSINFLVDEETLIEEHIVGIPGDQFIKQQMEMGVINEIRVAKEFVKFNERCFARLLGDMRAYNFVIDMTADFDDTQYRFRAIDFDQQCYEGRRTIYLPQFFKENKSFVDLCIKHLNLETVRQYQYEERSLMSRRLKSSKYRLNHLLNALTKDHISSEEKTKQLSEELKLYYNKDVFNKCTGMGEVLEKSLEILLEI